MRRLLALLVTCGLLGASVVTAVSVGPALAGSLLGQSSAGRSTLADGATTPPPPEIPTAPYAPGKWFVENRGPAPIQVPAPS